MSHTWEPIAELARKVRSGELKATDLVEKSLKIIEEKQEYRAIIAVLADSARARAKQIDQKPTGKLAGVPFIAKDNFLVFGADATAASNILRGFRPPYQATAIERLEAEGAVCVAKANLDAFAHGGSTENSDFFTTLNPHDKTRVPGGSSGGSAAAVVLGMAPFALGSDTGGSIRQPASFSGAVGFKPTYGLVSRSGVVAMASSTDVIGPLTMSVEDAALVLDVIAARDDMDSTTIESDAEGYQIPTTKFGLPHIKVGVIKEYFGEGLDKPVDESVRAAIDKIKQAGAEVQEVSLPTLPAALAVYYILVPAEVSSNLARYDGQRFGFSQKDAKNLDESYQLTRGNGFGKEAKRRTMIGTYVLSSGYYDAYYKKAQTVRTKLINEFNAAYEQFDFLIGPTAPSAAFKIGQNTSDPLKMYLSDVLTVAANLVGVPAISLPCGDDNGLPIGLQIMAPQRSDRELLGFANAVEELLG